MTRLRLGERLRARTRSWARGSETIRRWREERHQPFVTLCRVGPDERILDVGAGEGAALERFNKTNPIVAVDLRADGGGWLERDNVTVQVADGTQLPFPSRSFPIVFELGDRARAARAPAGVRRRDPARW